MSKIRRCPRCDAIIPRWQPVHLTCFFKRSWFIWATLLVILVVGWIGLAYLFSYLLS